MLNQRATSFSVARLPSATLVKQFIYLFIYLFVCLFIYLVYCELVEVNRSDHTPGLCPLLFSNSGVDSLMPATSSLLFLCRHICFQTQNHLFTVAHKGHASFKLELCLNISIACL